MTKSILIITGDGGESYEVLFALHRFQEAGYDGADRGPVEAPAAIWSCTTSSPAGIPTRRCPGYASNRT